MSENLYSLYGKTLPIEFTKGYINAFQHRVGVSIAMSLYQQAATIAVPETREYDKWLEPLHRHFVYGSHKSYPLDYVYLSLFQQGLCMRFKEVPVHNVTRQVGVLWWFGEPPASVSQNKHSLYTLLASEIISQLNEWKRSVPPRNLVSMKSHKELVQFGLSSFTRELQRQSSIVCTVDDSGNQLILTVQECPFCLAEPAHCRVFWGVVESFLSWFYGSHQPNALRTTLQFNEEASTSHTIVLDVLEWNDKIIN